MFRRVLTFLLLLPTAGASTALLLAQGLALDTVSVASNLEKPIAVVDAGDGPGRLFIAEQSGRIRLLEAGVLLPTPFLDISGLLETGGFEQGLLGLAFHPDYTTNGYFFVNYTEPASPPPDCPVPIDILTRCNANSVVARYQVSAASDDLADPGTAQILFKINEPRTNHNGGNLAFGPDGYLYIGLGDGGGGGDPYLNGQDLSTLHGAMLRIDVDGTPPTEPNDLCGENATAYGIPADNPYVGIAGACDEIWAYGLRNPWRFSFDRETGDLFIGDVGQNAIEEIDFQPASSEGGENYGWNCYEGSLVYPTGQTCSGPVEWPILEYPHVADPLDPTFFGVSVTGGSRYRGSQYPQLRRVYLFADWASGKVWGTVPRCDDAWEAQLLSDEPFRISTFGEDTAGEVYLTEYVFGSATSKVHQLTLAAGSGGPLARVPAALDFGDVQVGTKGVRELVLTNANAGPEALIVETTELANPTVFSLDPTGGSSPCGSLLPCLGPGDSCSMLVTFTPTAIGSESETTDFAGNTPPASVELTAIASACTAMGTRVLTHATVDDTRTEEACATLAVGSYEVSDGGDVTLRAGETVELRNGFSVRAGGKLTGDIDPGLLP